MSTKRHGRLAAFDDPYHGAPSGRNGTQREPSIKLDLVVKSDVAGTAEAVIASLESIQVPGVAIQPIQTGVGPVSKSDILMAQTGSRLVIGFNVDVVAKIQSQLKDFGVEIRLYDTIYQLTDDVKQIAEKMIPSEPREVITGKARVIATFKGKQKGIVIGCQVSEGVIELGNTFRVITAMGPAYTGTIHSMQIEKNPVKIAREGQQTGIGIKGWKNAKIGDWVECYELIKPGNGLVWQPQGRIRRFKSS